MPKENQPAIRIGERRIGGDSPVYIIAEMSANHAGSLDYDREIIHAAKVSGADCVKIQTYTADTMTIDCDNACFHIEEGTWKGENLYSLYQKAYTPWEWQARLLEEAQKVGIDFFSTPFDRTSVDFLESIGMQFYKIASFELVDLPLIRYVASKGKPIIMSTGMGTLQEITEAVEAAREAGCSQLALLRCASAYPAVSEHMNLAAMAEMEKIFDVPVGLSDHSMGSVGAVAAVALGGSIVEKHFCLDRKIKNPDASFSMEPEEFAAMVRDVRAAKRAVGSVSFGATEGEQGNLAFRRSVFVVQDIRAGETLTEENIRVIRPSDGLAPKYYETVLGRKAAVDLKRGTPLQMDMVRENGETQ